MAETKDDGMKFFSSVIGRPVARWGTGTMIGARIDASLPDGPGIVYDVDAVVAIPLAEFKRHEREYRKAIACKELVERTRSQHDTYVKAQAKAADDEAKTRLVTRVENDKQESQK